MKNETKRNRDNKKGKKKNHYFKKTKEAQTPETTRMKAKEEKRKKRKTFERWPHRDKTIPEGDTVIAFDKKEAKTTTTKNKNPRAQTRENKSYS